MKKDDRENDKGIRKITKKLYNSPVKAGQFKKKTKILFFFGKHKLLINVNLVLFFTKCFIHTTN